MPVAAGDGDHDPFGSAVAVGGQTSRELGRTATDQERADLVGGDAVHPVDIGERADEGVVVGKGRIPLDDSEHAGRHRRGGTAFSGGEPGQTLPGAGHLRRGDGQEEPAVGPGDHTRTMAASDMPPTRIGGTAAVGASWMVGLPG